MSLDFNSPVPLHVQLMKVIKSEIQNGKYSNRIPSERELMERFSVSRSTVREAVSSLVNKGILEKRHGKGTFITNHPVTEWLGRINSFTKTIESMGYRPGIRLLSHGTGRDEEIADILGVDQYYAIERLRYANDIPIAIERTYYAEDVGLKLAKHDLNAVTLYALLESLNIILYEAEQKITGSRPVQEDAALLGISPRDVVLAAERLTTDPKGRLIEYFNGVYRADKYAFCIQMSRKGHFTP